MENPENQYIAFKGVDEFYDFLSEEQLQMTLFLRALLMACIPDVREKLSFNVPYYKEYKNIAFTWPADILWGKKKTYETVHVWFT